MRNLVTHVDYIAACAEDTYFDQLSIAEAISNRIGKHGIKYHYSRETAWANASDLLSYVQSKMAQGFFSPGAYLEHF